MNFQPRAKTTFPCARVNPFTASITHVGLATVDHSIEREAERGRKHKAKLTTRGDVMAIIELYNTHKILPLAARLDAAEGALHYLTAPWWQRRLWDAKIIGGKVYKWLARRGIHLYALDAEAGSPPEEGSTPLPKGAATAAGPR